MPYMTNTERVSITPRCGAITARVSCGEVFRTMTYAFARATLNKRTTTLQLQSVFMQGIGALARFAVGNATCTIIGGALGV
jgi:hypothetical protein